MARAYDEVRADLLAIHGRDPHGVCAVVEEWNAILLCDFRNAVDIVLVRELVVEVIDHDEYGGFSCITRDVLDLLSGGVGCY